MSRSGFVVKVPAEGAIVKEPFDSNERFSTIMSVCPDDVADKPKMWDGIPSDFKGGRRSRTKKQSAQTAKELPAL